MTATPTTTPTHTTTPLGRIWIVARTIPSGFKPSPFRARIIIAPKPEKTTTPKQEQLRIALPKKEPMLKPWPNTGQNNKTFCNTSVSTFYN